MSFLSCYLPCLYGRVSYWPGVCPEGWVACPTAPGSKPTCSPSPGPGLQFITSWFVFVLFFLLNDGSRNQTWFLKFSKTSALSAFSTPRVHTPFQKVRFHVSKEGFILKHELQCISAHQFFQVYPLTAKVEYIVVVVVELMCLLQAFAICISLTAADHRTYSEKRKHTHISDLNAQTLGPAEQAAKALLRAISMAPSVLSLKLTALPVIMSVGSQVLNVSFNF